MPYALSFRYGQRHSVELDAARRVAEAQGVARHVVADIDLRVFGGSALTDDIDVPHHEQRRGPGRTGSRSPTCRPATRSSCRSRWPGRRSSGASDVFIGVNALDYSGYPDCRPEYIAAFEQMANLATKAGVEGRQHLRIHTPLIDLTKAQIIRARPGAGRGLLADPQLLRPGRRGPRVRDRATRACCGAGDSPKSAWRTRRWPCGAGPDGMTYRVKEIFYTLQGEGAHAGRPAVFCRFAGCNLWTGREKDRAPRGLPVLRHRLRRHRRPRRRAVRDRRGAGGGGRRRAGTVGEPRERAFVVCTGGEPLLQLDAAAVDALHARGFEVAVETNGTQAAPAGLDWVCVSPKAGAPLMLTSGDELKLVFPQEGAAPGDVRATCDFARLLPPADGRPGPRRRTPGWPWSTAWPIRSGG